MCVKRVEKYKDVLVSRAPLQHETCWIWFTVATVHFSQIIIFYTKAWTSTYHPPTSTHHQFNLTNINVFFKIFQEHFARLLNAQRCGNHKRLFSLFFFRFAFFIFGSRNENFVRNKSIMPLCIFSTITEIFKPFLFQFSKTFSWLMTLER